MNRRRAVSPSQGQRPLVKARETQDLRRRGAHGSTDPPTQSQDGSPRGADTAPEFKKTTSLSKPPRRQASRKRRRHRRRDARLARPFMKLPVVLLALDGAVVGGLAPRTFPEPALLRPAGATFYFHLRQWRRRCGVVRRLSLRVPQRLDDARSHADRRGDLGERRLHGRVKKKEGPVRVRAEF